MDHGRNISSTARLLQLINVIARRPADRLILLGFFDEPQTRSETTAQSVAKNARNNGKRNN